MTKFDQAGCTEIANALSSHFEWEYESNGNFHFHATKYIEARKQLDTLFNMLDNVLVDMD